MLHLTPHGCAAWGFHFRFNSDDPALTAVVARLYRDLPVAHGSLSTISARCDIASASPTYRVTITSADGVVEECGDGRGRDAVLELLCWEVNRRALWSAADEVVLHAAVIGSASGAIALCADSHGGKSTLAAAAARRGWRHLSDDMGLIDVDHALVTPYARPLMLRAGGRAHLRAVAAPPPEHLAFFPDEWFMPASALGASVGPDPLPLLAIGFLTFAACASLEPLSQAQTLHDLTLHSATVARQGGAGFTRLERLARTVSGVSVGLGAVDATLDLLSDLLRPTAHR